MSFAEQQPDRRRGSEGFCCRSATEQQRAEAEPCKMNVVVVFDVLKRLRVCFFIAVREGHHEFCRTKTESASLLCAASSPASCTTSS
jgi:hypothetical protein